MGEGYVDAAPEPTLLIVGDGEPLVPGIAHAAARHGLAVEECTLSLCAQTAVAVAPDAVLLVGDAVKDGGTEALGMLSASPLAAVVPVVLLSDEAEDDLGERLTAFRLGATAFIPRSASADGTAQRLAELVRDIPDRSAPQIGRVGEASLDAFVHTIARELRHGILSVRGDGEKGSDEEIRLVLGEGQGLTEAIRDFIGRVQQLIERTEVVHYEWQEDARGGVSLLSSLGAEGDGTLPSIEGTRVLLADDDVARADVVAQELRNLGAIVAVVDPQGRGLSRARALDPHALVVGQTVIHGPGLALLRRLRGDARMRWAHMIVVPWDEVWTDGEAPPNLDSLVRRIARATKVEKAIHDRIAAKKTFDVRLEALGAARLLRQIGLEQGTIRLTVWNLRGTVRVDVGQGLVIGARAMVPGKAGGVRDGTPGLACLLPMASGRARIEHVTSPMTTNVMSPVEVALGQAEDEIAAGPPEAPPHTLQQKSGGSMFPVAVAKTEPPPPRKKEEGEDIDVSLASVHPDEVVPTPAIVVAPLAPASAVVEPPTKSFATPEPHPERGSYGAGAPYLPRGRGAPAEGGGGDPAYHPDVEDVEGEPEPKKKRRRIPKPTMQGVAPPATYVPVAQPTPAAGSSRVESLRALAAETDALIEESAPKPAAPTRATPARTVEDQVRAISEEKRARDTAEAPARARPFVPKPAVPMHAAVANAAPPSRAVEPAPAVAGWVPTPPAAVRTVEPAVPLRAGAPEPAPVPVLPEPAFPSAPPVAEEARASRPPMLHAIPPPAAAPPDDGGEMDFEITVSDSVAPPLPRPQPIAQPAAHVEPLPKPPRAVSLETTMKMPRARAPEPRTGGCFWAVAMLVLLGGLAGAAWWTGYPPEAFRVLHIAPRNAGTEVAHASRPPEPLTMPTTLPEEPEPPPVSQVAVEEASVADAEEAEAEAGAEPEEDDGETPDEVWVTNERPERAHRPPTRLHPSPDGAHPSFAVPEWMSELGPITRERRSRELRDIALRNFRNRRYDRALTWYRRSWWFRESAETAAGIAATFLELDDDAEALVWAQHAVELNADSARALVILGDALRAAGRPAEARVTYEHALEIQPNNRDARRSLRRLRRLQRLQRRRGRAG